MAATADTANDTVVFSAAANDNSISTAEGDDSLSLNRALLEALLCRRRQRHRGRSLTVAGSSIAAGAGDDSLSISVLSNSTITGASGADTISGCRQSADGQGLWQPGR